MPSTGTPSSKISGGAAGEDDRFGLRRGERFRSPVERHDLGIHAALAHAARDQLRHLRAEIDDEDWGGHGWLLPRACAHKLSLLLSFPASRAARGLLLSFPASRAARAPLLSFPASRAARGPLLSFPASRAARGEGREARRHGKLRCRK
jgi:hypothetical protein